MGSGSGCTVGSGTGSSIKTIPDGSSSDGTTTKTCWGAPNTSGTTGTNGPRLPIGLSSLKYNSSKWLYSSFFVKNKFDINETAL